MRWKLQPSTYACPEHPKVDLSKTVWLEILSPAGDGTWIWPKGETWVGGDFSALRYDVTSPQRSTWRRAADFLSVHKAGEKSPEGPFTIRLNCPGIPGTGKEEDKPHRQTIRGKVVAP